jgi:carbonic anhydrase
MKPRNSHSRSCEIKFVVLFHIMENFDKTVRKLSVDFAAHLDYSKNKQDLLVFVAFLKLIVNTPELLNLLDRFETAVYQFPEIFKSSGHARQHRQQIITNFNKLRNVLNNNKTVQDLFNSNISQIKFLTFKNVV